MEGEKEFVDKKLRNIMKEKEKIKEMENEEGRIEDEIKRREKVEIFGDYDVEGECY